ncbi:MAG: 16S rRNA (uracil(1498)-N(3))-methyltransferase [Gammaproteobacteria bacterium]|nr:16S rRNA (uracil(1498)-N(3))-methyltransferase [Gammaproteobacteria bacterium]
MATPRFFVSTPLTAHSRLDLPEAAAHHAARVLRLRVGDDVVLFDGRGGEYAATITALGKHDVSVETGSHQSIERESSLDVTLVQAISSGERMDLTVQKAVELGVARIVPVESERCVVRLKGERAEKRVAHWRQIVQSACEQCGRNRVPEVVEISSLDHWLAVPGHTQRWLLEPEAAKPLRELSRPDRPVEILVGPEGGLTEAEIATATRAGFEPVRLGPRVLRTETAAPALLAAMQALWGDF